MEYSLVKPPMMHKFFFEEVADNTLEWEPVSVDVKQPTTATVNRGSMHRVNPNFENDAKMTVVVRKLEALEMSKEAQSSTPEPSKKVVSPICVYYDSQDHLVEHCPRIWVNTTRSAQLLSPTNTTSTQEVRHIKNHLYT